MTQAGNSAVLQKHGREALHTLQSSSNKSAKFYSQAGQKRLSKIWEDLNLSQEFIFTGFVGPTDAFIREQVSDYIQNYLQLRSGWFYRSGIQIKSDLSSESKLSSDRRASYLKYNEYQRKLNRMRDAARKQSENERITQSIMEGLIEPVLGIAEICDNPIYKTNKLADSISELKQKDPKQDFNFSQKVLPRIIDGTKLRRNSRKKSVLKNDSIKSVNSKASNTVGSISSNKIKIPRIYTSTPKPLSRSDSVSSGFIEISPSNNLTQDLTQEDGSDTNVYDDRECESQTTNADYGLCEVSKKINNLKIAQLEKEKTQGISDDINFPCTFPWELHLKQAYKTNNVSEIYETNQAVVDVYRRQMAVGNEFIEDWNTIVVKKQLQLSD